MSALLHLPDELLVRILDQSRWDVGSVHHNMHLDLVCKKFARLGKKRGKA
jgi:hypothetical protein